MQVIGDRRLYNNILPDVAGILEFTESSGVCVDGIEISSCSSADKFIFVASSARRSSPLRLGCSSLNFFMIVGFVFCYHYYFY